MLNEAIKKLDPKSAAGRREQIMAPSVAQVLQDFCRQDGEFAQAVAQGGSFKDCMTAVAKGVGGSISDIDAYKKAVQFYFPGAEIRVQMSIDLIGERSERCRWQDKRGERVAAVEKAESGESLNAFSGTATGAAEDTSPSALRAATSPQGEARGIVLNLEDFL